MIRGGILRAVLAMGGIFVAGAIAGGFAGAAWHKHKSPSWRTSTKEYAARHLERMTCDLSLTDEQVAQIRPVMEQFGERFRAIRRQSLAETAKLFEEMNRQIEPVLTPEQLPIHREKIAKQRAKFERASAGAQPADGAAAVQGGAAGEPPPPQSP